MLVEAFKIKKDGFEDMNQVIDFLEVNISELSEFDDLPFDAQDTIKTNDAMKSIEADFENLT